MATSLGHRGPGCEGALSKVHFNGTEQRHAVEDIIRRPARQYVSVKGCTQFFAPLSRSNYAERQVCVPLSARGVSAG
jgi:hypothetical protein